MNESKGNQALGEKKMKMTKSELKRIIQEEKKALLESAATYRDRRTGENLFFIINEAIDKLLNNGFDAIELANELRGLADDVEESAPMKYGK